MKKRFCFFVAMAVSLVVFLESMALPAAGMEPESESVKTAVAIHVSCTEGNDANDGSAEAPFKTLEHAKEYIRNINDHMTGDILVYLHGGRYEINAPLEFSEEDSGTNGYTVRYLAYNGENVEISGGKQITGWSLYDVEKGIYRAVYGGEIESRVLYVNGERRIRAKSDGGLSDCSYLWKEDYTGEKTDLYNKYTTGFTTTDPSFLSLTNFSDVEMVYLKEYQVMRCRIGSVVKDGNTAKVTMGDGEGIGYTTQTAETAGWYELTGRGNDLTAPAYYENAYELLDQSGEWYLNRKEHCFYYKPYPEENMDEATVIAGVQEQLAVFDGTPNVYGFDHRVSYISFENIRFAHTTWNRGLKFAGVAFSQANLIRPKNINQTDVGFYDALPIAAISIESAYHIGFRGCEFEGMGSNAINIYNGSCGIVLDGNCFHDLSGSAVCVGESAYRDNSAQISNGTAAYDSRDHYYPDDMRKLIRNISVINNEIYQIGKEYPGAVAISAGYPVDSQFDHNEIHDVPYSGIHIGGGWDSWDAYGTEAATTVSAAPVLRGVSVSGNKISQAMNSRLYDGGSIYVLGNTSGNAESPNVIADNYLEKQKGAYAFIYPDVGSQRWNITGNVVDARDCGTWYVNDGQSLLSDTGSWFMGQKATKNMTVTGNYSTTEVYHKSAYFDAIVNDKANHYIFENANVVSDGVWSGDANETVEQSGINNSCVPQTIENLIFNGAFHSDLAMWENTAVNADVSMVWEEDGGINGSGCIRVSDAPLKANVFLEGNGIYHISAKVKTEEETADVQIALNCGDGTGDAAKNQLVGNTWKEISFDYACVESQPLELSISALKENGTKCDLLVDDVSVVKTDDTINRTMVFDGFEASQIEDNWSSNTSYAVLSRSTPGVGESTGAAVLEQSAKSAAGLTRNIYFEQGKTYYFSLWIKAENMSSVPQKGVTFYILNQNNGGSNVQHTVTESVLTEQWQYVTFVYTHEEPSGLAQMEILPQRNGLNDDTFFSNGPVKIYYDDVMITTLETEEGKAPHVKVQEKFQEDMGGFTPDTYVEAAWSNEEGVDHASGCLLVTQKGGSSASAKRSIKQSFSFEQGKTYRISAWIKMKDETTPVTGEISFAFAPTQGSAPTKHTTGTVATTDWEKADFVYTAPSTYDADIYINAQTNCWDLSNSETDVSFYLDHFKIEEFAWLYDIDSYTLETQNAEKSGKVNLVSELGKSLCLKNVAADAALIQIETATSPETRYEFSFFAKSDVSCKPVVTFCDESGSILQSTEGSPMNAGMQKYTFALPDGHDGSIKIQLSVTEPATLLYLDELAVNESDWICVSDGVLRVNYADEPEFCGIAKMTAENTGYAMLRYGDGEDVFSEPFLLEDDTAYRVLYRKGQKLYQRDFSTGISARQVNGLSEESGAEFYVSNHSAQEASLLAMCAVYQKDVLQGVATSRESIRCEGYLTLPAVQIPDDGCRKDFLWKANMLYPLLSVSDDRR